MAQGRPAAAPKSSEKGGVDVQQTGDQSRWPDPGRARQARRRPRLLRRDLPAGQVRRDGDPRASGCRTTTPARPRTSCAGCTSSSATASPSSCAAAAARSTTSVVDLRKGSPTYGQCGGLRTDRGQHAGRSTARSASATASARSARSPTRSTSRASTTGPGRRRSSATRTRRSASSGRSRSRSCRRPRRTRRRPP